MATASYSVYDVHQLRSSLDTLDSNHHIITQRLDTVIDDVTHLAAAQVATSNIIRSLDQDVTDMETFVQLMQLQQTTADYCYQTAASLDQVLQHRLTTGLVS